MKHKSLISNLLTTAVEGGSNYWYYVSLPDDYETIKALSFADNVINYLSLGHRSIPILDCNDHSEVLGHLTYEALKTSLNALKRYNKEIYDSVMEESFDADEADLWFQLVVMGEVVYC